MARILNKKEIKKLVELGIISKEKDDDYYIHNYYTSDSISPEMIGENVKKAKSEKYNVYPWMIKKNWKKTGIFK